MQSPTMAGRDWLLLVTLSVLWGGSFFFSEVALGELGPFTVVLGRVGIAGRGARRLRLSERSAHAGHARALGRVPDHGRTQNLIPFSLIVWGQVHIDSGLASILNATTPLFAVTLTHLLTRDERMTRGRAAGVLLGLAGVAVLVGPEALGLFGAQGLAQLAVLGAAFSYACAGIYGRRFKGLPPAVAAAGMVTCSAVLTLPLALVVERPWEASPGALTWAAVLGLALLSTAFAYLIYFRILAAVGATNLLLVTFLIPVSALLLGTLVLGERPDAAAFAGMALIFAGLAAVDGRLFARLRGGGARRSPGRARPRSRPG